MNPLDYNAWRLSNIAECSGPDKLDSPGAKFLLGVQDAVNELDEIDPDNLYDPAHEIADSAPDVYTYPKWQQFVDLAAWQEDLSEYGPLEDMDKGASICLYMIAERLAVALMQERYDSTTEEV